MKRVGIVGCGNIARVHAWALKQLTDVEIVAFCDIDSNRAASFAKEYTDGQARTYVNLEEMLLDKIIDVLHICTPHYLHVPMAKLALKHNVSVFCEKPPAINMDEFDELCKLTEDLNARMGFCFQNRYNGTIKKTDEILNTGELGYVIGARAFVTWRRDEDYYSTDWKGIIATEGGGTLINQSIHTLDLLLRYMGSPVEVKANISNHHLAGVIEVEDTVDAWLRFEDGKRACFYATTAYVTDAPVILELQCEKGSITIVDKQVTLKRADSKAEMFLIEENDGVGKNYWGNGHLACIKDFYDKMYTGERFPNDPLGVRNTMETMMKIYEHR